MTWHDGSFSRWRSVDDRLSSDLLNARRRTICVVIDRCPCHVVTGHPAAASSRWSRLRQGNYITVKSNQMTLLTYYSQEAGLQLHSHSFCMKIKWRKTKEFRICSSLQRHVAVYRRIVVNQWQPGDVHYGDTWVNGVVLKKSNRLPIFVSHARGWPVKPRLYWTQPPYHESFRQFCANSALHSF